jgi:hypothetical protein
MPSLLSLNWLAYHKEENDFNIFQRWQPKSIKLFQDHWRDPFLIERLYAMLPNTVFVLRDHPLSEQKQAMEADPEGTGRAHADYWHGVYGNLFGTIKTFDLNRSVFLGINEPPVGDDTARGIVTAYTVAFLDRLQSYGLSGGALNLSVGWPDNTGQDTPVNWVPFGPVHDAIKRGAHYLMLHEYFSPAGPQHNFGWWAGRLGQCPWNVPIIVGECGIDHGVVDGNLTGWQSYVNKEQYMAQLVEYDRLMRRDPRVHSLQIFSYDFTDRWWSFDVRPLQQEIAAYAESERGKQDATISFPYYPPTVKLEPEPNVRIIDMGSAHSSSRAGHRVKKIIVHSTVTPLDGSLESTARYLVRNDRQVSIHELVGANTVYRMVPDSLAAHHTWSETVNIPGVPRNLANLETWGIEGLQYATHPTAPPVVDLMVERVAAACRRFNLTAADVLSHGEVDPGRRSDPVGVDMADFRKRVAALLAPVPVPAPSPPPPLQYAKIAWGVEAIARLLQTEGWQAEHDHLLASEVYKEAVAKR